MKRVSITLSLKLDLLGFSASTLCAIHCAAIPFILTFIPLLGLDFLTNHTFEFFMIGISLFAGSFSFINGYFNHHRSFSPFIFFIIGFSIIISAHFLLPLLFEYIAAPVGAMFIAYSHLLNRKFCRDCKVCN